ncbi:MAG TPA: hypothetical protein VIH90_04290 [Candidatus Saccharimonadales bacterium]
MSLFLITGLPGTGKSTVRAELVTRGIEAYDGDEDHLAHWYDDAGIPVPIENEVRTPEFVNTHTRDIARQTVVNLATRAIGIELVFLCGDPENEDKLQDIFTGIFALTLDDKIRQHRLDIRKNNPWGKLPHEREYDQAHIDIALNRYKRPNYITIDASQTPENIVDFILRTVTSKKF